MIYGMVVTIQSGMPHASWPLADLTDFLSWCREHWMMLLIAAGVVLALVMTAIPLVKKILRNRKAKKEAKRLSDDLLLRKQLSEVAQGGKAGKQAETEVLQTRYADMQSSFQQGLQTFRQSGRKVYDLPWYVMLGEPGAGKSSAMRKSELDFPPGIVEMSQGEGGTSSMHWWITQNGALLDVAGRVLFAEWGEEGNAEWVHFLQQLRKARPKCSINGIVLAIPADSLAADDEGLLQRKAKLLTDQLHTLQGMLGLCLPVYVVVTKMDMLVGFREFFQHMDTDQRRKMLGWSNHAPRGEYQSEQLAEYFSELDQKFRGYCSSLLMLPRLWEPGVSHRAAGVDALYAFPKAMQQIRPALDWYLKTIFSQSRWSGKGFLRCQGVYFTSALDEGVALDADSTAALGVGVESWAIRQTPKPEKSFFLHDIFQAKVFRESGLVEVDPRSAIRRRRPWTVASLVFLLLAGGLAALTALNFSSLHDRANEMADYWQSIKQVQQRDGLLESPLIVKDDRGRYVYMGEQPMNGLTAENQLVVSDRDDFLDGSFYRSQKKIPLPMGYAFSNPWEGTLGNDLLTRQRRQAYRVIYSKMVFLPLVKAARDRMRSLRDTCPSQTVDALAELLRMEKAGFYREAPGQLAAQSRLKPFRYEALVTFTFYDQSQATAVFLSDDVMGASDFHTSGWEYDIRNPQSPLFAMLRTGTPGSQEAILWGVKAFCKNWTGGKADPEMLLPQLRRLVAAMSEFQAAEASLLALQATWAKHGSTPWTYAEAKQLLQQWQKRFNRLQKAHSSLRQTEKQIVWGEKDTAESLLAKASKAYSKQLESEFSQLLAECELPSQYQHLAGDFWVKMSDRLTAAKKTARRVIAGEIQAAGTELKKVSSDVWAVDKASKQRLYAIRFSLYSRMNQMTQQKSQVVDIIALQATLASIRKQFKQAEDDWKTQSQPYAKVPKISAVTQLAKNLRDLMQRTINYETIDAAVKKVPDSSAELAQAVKKVAAGKEPIYQPALPMTEYRKPGEFDARYHPKAAAEYLDALQQLMAQPRNPKDPVLLVDEKKLGNLIHSRQQAVTRYETEYVEYWSRQIWQRATVLPVANWKAYHAAITPLKAFQINGALLTMNRQSIKALAAIKPSSTELKNEVKKGLLAAQVELALLTDLYNKTCEEVLQDWRELGGDPKKAREKMLSISGRQLQQTLLLPYSQKKISRMPYWNQFLTVGVAALGNDSQAIVKDATKELAKNYMLFPLCNMADRQTVLAQPQILEAAKELSHILPLPQKPELPQSAQLNTPAQTPGPAADSPLGRQLARLKPEARGDALQKKWFEQLQSVLKVLKDTKKPLVWTLVIPDMAAQNQLPVLADSQPAWSLVRGMERYRYFEVYLRGRRIGKRKQTMMSNGKLKAVEEWTFTAMTENLEFCFYQNANDAQPGARVRFAGPWSGISLYLQSGGVFNSKSKTFFVPVIFTDRKNYNCFYWVGMKFDRHMPLPSQWPTPQTWPGGEPDQQPWPNLNKTLANLLANEKLAAQKASDFKAARELLVGQTPTTQTVVWELMTVPYDVQKRVPTPSVKEKTESRVERTPDGIVKDKKSKPVYSAVSLCRYMELHVNGKRVGKRTITSLPSGLQSRGTGLVFPVGGSKVSLLFFEHLDSKKPSVTIPLDSKWPGFMLLLGKGAQAEIEWTGFRMPLEFKDTTGRRLYYWLGLRVTRK